MKKSTRIKVPGLATLIEFHAAIDELATLETQKRAIDAQRDLRLQEVNQAFDTQLGPIASRMKALGALALAYAEEHRSELLAKDAKSAKTSLATYGWRLGNRTVGLLPKVTAETVINALKAFDLGEQYVRLKEEINREAVLQASADSKTLPHLRKIDDKMQDLPLAAVGLRITQSETFFVEPASATDAAETLKPEAAA